METEFSESDFCTLRPHSIAADSGIKERTATDFMRCLAPPSPEASTSCEQLDTVIASFVAG
jgi:hypothetical protein